MEVYVLLKDFDWFGKTIPKGSIYRQYLNTTDNYGCHTTKGLKCPHWDLTFMTVRNNPEWFFELNSVAIGTAFFKEIQIN